MEFSFMMFYLKPEKSFDFSYKLQHLIPDEVNKKVFSKGKSIPQTDWEIYFWVSCSTMNKDFELGLDNTGKRNKKKLIYSTFL